ncbi:MAG: DUF6728 family protein [Cytophagales bacterium]|nr:hypothetical protein [Bernardetiaceae bacterium]MDW8211228.1 DUF6728 family protein [Cytophagales bacterium]
MTSASESPKRNKNTLADYFSFGPLFEYFLRVFKKDGGSKYINFNLRMMHGINRISIIMFLICMIVILIRRILV